MMNGIDSIRCGLYHDHNPRLRSNRRYTVVDDGGTWTLDLCGSLDENCGEKSARDTIGVPGLLDDSRRAKAFCNI